MSVNVNKKGFLGDNIISFLLWVVFLILAGLAVWFLIKKIT